MSDINEIDMQSLRQFVQVARSNSFSKAANLLAIPAPTLSRRISKLEAQLGFRLFHRTTRSVHLSEQGQRFFERVNEPVLELEHAALEMSKSMSPDSGPIRIATTNTMAYTNILPVLPAFRADFPNIKVELLLDTRIVDMREKGVDFAIRAGELADSTQIVRKIADHAFYLYGAPDIADQARPDMLAYQPEFGEKGRTTFMVRDMPMIKQMVLSGYGVAWMPEDFCTEEEKNGILVRISSQQSHAFGVYIAYPEKAFVTSRARELIKRIIAYAATRLQCTATSSDS